jgi:hypothetical protein
MYVNLQRCIYLRLLHTYVGLVRGVKSIVYNIIRPHSANPTHTYIVFFGFRVHTTTKNSVYKSTKEETHKRQQQNQN